MREDITSNLTKIQNLDDIYSEIPDKDFILAKFK